MKTIVINKEYYPKRCEICHCDDMFEPESNYCQRCASLSLALIKPRDNGATKKSTGKENTVKERQEPFFDIDQVALAVLMVLAVFNFQMFPEQFGQYKQTLRMTISIMGLLLASLRFLSNRPESRLRGFSILVMISVFSIYEVILKWLMQIF